MANSGDATRHAKLVARLWHDPAHRARFVKSPAEVLKEHGIDYPAGAKVHVHQNSDTEYHVVIPAKPKHLEGKGIEDHEKVALMFTSPVIC